MFKMSGNEFGFPVYSVDPSCVPILDLMAVNILSKTSHTDDDPYTTEDLFFIRNHYKILSPVHMLMNVDFNNMQV